MIVKSVKKIIQFYSFINKSVKTLEKGVWKYDVKSLFIKV